MPRTTLFLLAVAVLSGVAFLGRPAAAPSAPPAWPPAAAAQVDGPSRAAAPPPTAEGAGVSVAVQASHGAALAEGGELYAAVTVGAAKDLSPGPSQAVGLVIVLDRSGSMAGRKLEQAREAAERLINAMDEGDELAVVAFGSEVRASEPYRVEGASGRLELLAFVEGLTAEGATDLAAGLTEGQRLLSRMTGARRLVLISDGQPTAGDTSADGLGRLVDGVHAAGVTVTALGVGYDFDSRLLQALAERGGGLFGALDDAARLGEVLALELGQARAVAARGVVLRLTPGPRVTIEEVPGRLAEEAFGGVALRLADLRPGDRTVVYVRLRTDATVGDHVALLSAQVQWVNATGSSLLSAGALRLPVVSDRAAHEATRDEPLFAAGVRAVGTTKMVAAADALSRGDNEGALALLRSARAIFGMSAEALAGDSEVARRLESDWRTRRGDSARSAAHELERKSLQNFGKENDGY